ncbi:cytochrome P450 [Bipolaris maydis]|nr:cytochrome P450 [Bipolaris maydis]KAJ6193804.1 cytochrome P450 [Bipolaris maydis]
MAGKCPRDLVPIPGPKPIPFLGNILDIDPDNFTKSLGEMGKTYGDVYMINYGSYRDVIVVSRKVAEELCDETRFCKLPGGAIDRMRRVVGHGLFTAETADPRYQKAHRVIAPLFGAARIRAMADDMRDICEQMCLRWARFGQDVPIEICDEMTKLTLDTIALCTVDYRFNSFYRPAGVEDPFAEAVVDTMTESLLQSNLPDWINNWVRFRSMNKFNRQADQLRHDIEKLIEMRLKNPVDRNDLLNAMLSHEDPNTGQRLDDESVVDNLLTFFIAGHETTSSLLSFCFYYLLQYPEVLQKARDEVDAVIGSSTVMPEHLQKLPYLESILRETLRLRDPGPGFFVKPLQDEVIAGKYLVPKDQSIFIVFDSVHRDPDVYGDDADEFRPERMEQDKFDKLPPCAWKPFGNGMRACIGRPFAMQQALIAVAMVLQNFDLIKDETYNLKIQVTMTVRPVGLTMKVRPRNGIRPTEMSLRMHQGADTVSSTESFRPIPIKPTTGPSDNEEVHLAIVHASNSGTSEALASVLANDATKRGLGIKLIDTANNVVGKLPKDVVVVTITASYNGEPARDAVNFVNWLKAAQEDELEGVRYAVFGCGHRDWNSSFFAVPKLVDSLLSERGAERVAPMGTSDMGASTDIFSDFEQWTTTQLFPKLSDNRMLHDGNATCVTDARDVELQVSLIKPPLIGMREGFAAAIVTDARTLSSPGVAEKRHLEIRLPVGFKYKSGDHVQILPRNSVDDTRSALGLFDLDTETLVNIWSIKRNMGLGLPLDTPIRASELFSAYVDLGRTASLRNIQVLATLMTTDKPQVKANLFELLEPEKYRSEVLNKRISVLDLLHIFPDVKISLANFLSLLTPIRPRAYSFSSSPDWKPGFATLTYTVVGSAKSLPTLQPMEPNDPFQDPNGGLTEDCIPFKRGGLASTYLSTLTANNSLYISLHPASPNFSQDQPVSLPVIMVAAGTGIAPFLAFLQDRKITASAASRSLEQAGKRKNFPKTILFYGCRGPALDSLYAKEIAAFEADGLVEVRRAFSRDHEAAAAEAAGCKYIHERLADSKNDIVEIWKAGGRVLVCGGKNVANSAYDVLGPLLWETDKQYQKSEAKSLQEWRDALEKDRYVEEFFL